MRVASTVGTLHFAFGLAKPLGSRVIRYVRDERTDGRTDRQKQRLLPLPYVRGNNKRSVLWHISDLHFDLFGSKFIRVLSEPHPIFLKVLKRQTD